MSATQSLPEELNILLRQLVMQNQIRIAADVLTVFFIREWKQSVPAAAYLMRRYFEKYYADQVSKFRQRVARQQ